MTNLRGLLLIQRKDTKILKPERVWVGMEYLIRITVTENISLSELLTIAI